MFKRRTLFIAGAGASKEVRFPIGPDLAQTIADNMRPNDRTHATHITDTMLLDEYRARVGYNNGYSPFMAAARRIHEGIELTHSVDDFLNVHKDDPLIVELGKAAIVRAILKAESGCDMYVDQSNTYNKMGIRDVSTTWFVRLMRVLAPGSGPKAAAQAFHNVSFIVFNYDRCIEHFLEYSISALYGVERMKAREIVKQITIIHPYGQIADLDRLAFGGEKNREYAVLPLAARIKTYTESFEDEEQLGLMRDEVVNSECIVFLGSSYLEQNMTLLRPENRMVWKPVFGTALGLSDNDRRVVEEELYAMFQDAGSREFIVLDNKSTCAGLFESYARSLNAGKMVM